MPLDGKVAMVSGAARGIGAAIAERLVAEGAHVVVLDREVAAGRATARRLGRADFREVDVSRADEVRAAVEATVAELGGVQILVNNAGIANNTTFLEVSEEEFERVVAVNLTSQFLLGQAVARHMVERGEGGAIVNISSVTAHGGVATQAAYASAKGGVESLTRVMAVALAHEGIRVNAVAPGSTATPMVADFFAQKPELRTMMLSRIPLRRLAEPDELASVVAFLASEDASYLTGQVLIVDGGRRALNYTVPVDDEAGER
ncbi:SDR family NAD(P)-dependent oxidoreductase [Nocardioides sp. QY071]|uniref:SDR family NAD(P)-dependent oxidoreductase n=1 Tax=Nocardioides sp. QY071 TaxID=3044187 RepID=UPI00249B50D9|nr:SDR family NAD(P)-dependent oxidoreductase [Nocardioides sp. QY071]WGY00381.1 SDR family NAD(P)-dependent oxidoreductase [Nocardioides sp. QY071]